MTQVVNIYGGPGVGKSTIAAKLFAEFKVRGLSVELVTEYAKDLVYEKRQHTFEFYEYVAARQQHRIERLLGKVDLVVTDSPLLLCLVYAPEPPGIGREHDRYRCWVAYLEAVHRHWDTIDCLLKRDMNIPYDPRGRNQKDLRTACKIDQQIEEMLYYQVGEEDLIVSTPDGFQEHFIGVSS